MVILLPEIVTLAISEEIKHSRDGDECHVSLLDADAIFRIGIRDERILVIDGTDRFRVIESTLQYLGIISWSCHHAQSRPHIQYQYEQISISILLRHSCLINNHQMQIYKNFIVMTLDWGFFFNKNGLVLMNRIRPFLFV